MSLTEEPTRESTPTSGDLETLESLIKARQTRRDGWTLMIWAFAAVALFASAVAIGFGMRAIDESKDNAGDRSRRRWRAARAGDSHRVLDHAADDLGVARPAGSTSPTPARVEHNLAVQGTDLKTAMIPLGRQRPPRPLRSRRRHLHRVLRGGRPPGVGHAGDAPPRSRQTQRRVGRRRQRRGGHSDDDARADGPGDEGLDHGVPGEDRGARRAGARADDPRRRHEAVRPHDARSPSGRSRRTRRSTR